MAVQIGVPLNNATLSRMSEEENNFWMDFLQEAFFYIDDMRLNDDDAPLSVQAPPFLVEKYKKAITQYNGKIYCQIKQLENIFKF